SGGHGAGTFTQSDTTTNTVSTNLYLGYNATDSGTYNLSTGSLAVTGNEYVGYSGTGVFSQSGGSNAVTHDLVVGYAGPGTGTYDLSAGTLGPANEYIGGYTGSGGHGAGTFTQSDTTTNTVSNNLFLGYNATDSGTYNLSAGSLAVTGNEYVGYSGTGTFSQGGGTNTVAIMDVATNSGSTGTYNLNGGTLTATTVNLN